MFTIVKCYFCDILYFKSEQKHVVNIREAQPIIYVLFVFYVL